MEIVKIRSKKHPGAIFLKVKETKEDFICKIYPCSDSESRANIIINAFLSNSDLNKY